MTKTHDDAAMNEHGVPETERARLAAAWAAAHYFVAIGRKEWLFRAGQRTEDIERQLPADHYLFITAWNPPPGEATRQANLEAGERLHARLVAAGCACRPALGCDSQGGATEHGWLVLDMPLERADALAREFGQGGILYWRRGEPVRLRMQWPRPPGVVDEWTDWAG